MPGSGAGAFAILLTGSSTVKDAYWPLLGYSFHCAERGQCPRDLDHNVCMESSLLNGLYDQGLSSSTEELH